MQMEREEHYELGLKDGLSLGERKVIEGALKKGRAPEQIAEFNGVPLQKVLEIRDSMLQEA